MGIISFAGKIIDLKRGLVPVFGRTMTLARERGRARSLRRLERPEARLKEKIMAAEQKGSVSGVKRAEKKLVKLLHRKGSVTIHLFEGEERIEYNVIKDIEGCEMNVNRSKAQNSRDVLDRLKKIAKSFQDLAELELGKVAYLMEGGQPWEGRANIASYDIGTTDNVVLGEAVKQRRMLVTVRSSLNLVNKYSSQIYDEMRQKVPRIDIIKKSQDKQELALKKLETTVFNELVPSFRFQFYCILRLINFVEYDDKAQIKLAEKFMKEGYPEKQAQEIAAMYIKEINALKKEESEEQKRLGLIAGEGARAA